MSGDDLWFAVFATISGRTVAAGGSPWRSEAEQFGHLHRSEVFRYVGCRSGTDVEESARVEDDIVIRAALPISQNNSGCR